MKSSDLRPGFEFATFNQSVGALLFSRRRVLSSYSAQGRLAREYPISPRHCSTANLGRQVSPSEPSVDRRAAFFVSKRPEFFAKWDHRFDGIEPLLNQVPSPSSYRAIEKTSNGLRPRGLFAVMVGILAIAVSYPNIRWRIWAVATPGKSGHAPPTPGREPNVSNHEPDYRSPFDQGREFEQPHFP